MMELIADKKGMDESIFKTIRAELDKMKKKVENDGNAGNRRPPPSSVGGDAKLAVCAQNNLCHAKATVQDILGNGSM